MRRPLDSDHLLHLLLRAGGLIALVFLVLLSSIRLFSLLRPSVAPSARPSSAANSTSAMFGFDLPHTHLNPSERILTAVNVSRLVLSWIGHPGDVIYSSPTVANGVVYIGSDDGKLYAFDARTGMRRWTALTGKGIFSSPAVADGVVYVGS